MAAKFKQKEQQGIQNIFKSLPVSSQSCLLAKRKAPGMPSISGKNREIILKERATFGMTGLTHPSWSDVLRRDICVPSFDSQTVG